MLPISSDQLLSALRAAGEPTRLRILALLAEGERNVKDLTDILGQSQPRLSRHLKLLVEAGLLRRNAEGASAFFRLSDQGPAAEVARDIVDRLDRTDPVLVRDRTRLEAVRRAHAENAAAYFRRHAGEWDRLRTLHVEDGQVEATIARLLDETRLGTVIDLGTGTGRMLEMLGPKVGRGIGIDLSHDMLAYARNRLEQKGLTNCQVRHGDIYNLPLDNAVADAVIVHQVLHYLDDPARAVAEAARLLRRGGRLIIVDFAPHGLEFLRERHAHRRLGFADAQIREWMQAAGVDPLEQVELPPDREAPDDRLTVSIWLGRHTGHRARQTPVSEEAA